MAQVILQTQDANTPELFESFEALFQELSRRGLKIEKVEDGLIKAADQDGKAIDIVFGVLASEGTAASFVKEVESLRDALRASMAALKNQGIQIPANETAKLKEQFAFLTPKKPTAKK